MVVFAFVGIMALIFWIGVCIAGATIIGLILCRIYENRTQKKARLWIRIILVVLLVIGIALVLIPSLYAYMIYETGFKG